MSLQHDAEAVLAEVDRLRAELDALRGMAEADAAFLAELARLRAIEAAAREWADADDAVKAAMGEGLIPAPMVDEFNRAAYALLAAVRGDSDDTGPVETLDELWADSTPDTGEGT